LHILGKKSNKCTFFLLNFMVNLAKSLKEKAVNEVPAFSLSDENH